MTSSIPEGAKNLTEAQIPLEDLGANAKVTSSTSLWGGSRTVSVKNIQGDRVELSMGQFMKLAKNEYDTLYSEAKNIKVVTANDGKLRQEKLGKMESLVGSVASINKKEQSVFGASQRNEVIEDMYRGLIKPIENKNAVKLLDIAIKNVKEEIRNTSDPQKIKKLTKELNEFLVKREENNQVVKENWGDYDLNEDLNAMDKDVRDQGNV